MALRSQRVAQAHVAVYWVPAVVVQELAHGIKLGRPDAHAAVVELLNAAMFHFQVAAAAHANGPKPLQIAP